MTVEEYTKICMDFATKTSSWDYLPTEPVYSTTSRTHLEETGNEWEITPDNAHGGVPVGWAYGKNPVEILESAKNEYFQYFAEQMEQRVSEFLPEELQIESVEQVTVRKNNDSLLHGLTIREADINVSPTIYLEDYFDRFCDEIARPDNTALDSLAGALAKVYVENRIPESIDLSHIQNWDSVKERVEPRLVNANTNMELLRERPHTLVGNEFAVTYHIIVQTDSRGSASIPINNVLMESYPIDITKLHQQAMENNKRMHPAQITNMLNMLSDLLPVSEMDGMEMDGLEDALGAPKMYVITNQEKSFGAISIIDPDVMDMIGERLNCDEVYVIPSSVHECILIPNDGLMKPSELDVMIRDVNATQLAPQEILGESAMVMYPKEHKLMLCKNNEPIVQPEVDNKILPVPEQPWMRKEMKAPRL